MLETSNDLAELKHMPVTDNVNVRETEKISKKHMSIQFGDL